MKKLIFLIACFISLLVFSICEGYLVESGEGYVGINGYYMKSGSGIITPDGKYCPKSGQGYIMPDGNYAPKSGKGIIYERERNQR